MARPLMSAPSSDNVIFSKSAPGILQYFCCAIEVERDYLRLRIAEQVVAEAPTHFHNHQNAAMHMDSVSLLLPQQQNKPLSQEDFDSRYNYVRYRKKKTNKEVLRRTFIGDYWRHYSSRVNLLPVVAWVPRYNFKTSLLKDSLGSLLLALLFIPQGIAYGVVINDLRAGIFSLFLPQLLYTLFGSARHSSIGALSLTSIMVYSSLQHSKSTISSIALSCGVFQFLQFMLPLEFLYAYISSSVLSGFSLGLFIRIVIRFTPNFIVFRGEDCEKMLNKNDRVKRVLQCFYATVPCLRSNETLLMIMTLATVFVFAAFKWRLNGVISSRVGFSIPYEFIVLLICAVTSHFIKFAPPTTTNVTSIPAEILFRAPSPDWPDAPSWSTALDSLAISMYAVASHVHMSKWIAMEKMHTIHRKQELLCFSIISLAASFFGVLPPSSSYGSSQINVETSKFSLVSNALSTVWMALIICFGAPLLGYVSLMQCILSAMVVLSFSGWISDLKTLRELFCSSPWDAALALSGILCAVFFPNTCTAFLCVLFISIFSVALRVQWPNFQTLVKLSDAHFGEEKRYEGDCLDTPVRIVRLCGPLIYANCEALRRELRNQAVAVKGLIGIGIGTRTASLRSQCPSNAGPRESVAARSSVNLTNIIVTQDFDLPQAPPGDSLHSIRFIILSCNGVNTVDKDALQTLSQLYGELSHQHIKLIFAGVPATVRDSMEVLGFYNQVPRSSFFPNLQEALSTARHLVLPFHMSVSMNGCRDVIALSTTASNMELNRASPEIV
ncbi:unnamed protein product [Caenorhabditis auriculariae]|uniref:STAS domain-containing protein n=1 Tax=Caenorhabditis auriculariae TaxID=2777116 RepID=A0A8S1GXK3_9PELO|nr:unnamed protein product [Caenorhabditis auriculariae]